MRTRQVRQHGLANKPLSRIVIAALAMLVCIAVPTAGPVFAAPASTTNDAPVAEVNLGGGSYRVTASVFAEGTDGQVGTTASSGHVIQPNDNLVALPGCTESSCPWVPVGTGVEGTYGPQTECAEADGLCWVEIVSDTTGECTVAPVHDRGPLFIRDNWWAPQNLREYNVPQGTPAAESARNGANFGFGAGISDAGYDIRNVYTYAAGIDLAGGTWQALDLPVSAGITTVTVTMLWQTGLTHDQACGNSPSPVPTPSPNPTTGNATVIDGTLNLRSNPSYSASIVTVMPGNSRVTVTGGSQSGFYPVTYSGTAGWALGTYLSIDAGKDPGSDDDPPPTGETATVIDGSLNLRSSASTGGSVLLVLPDGATVTLTGQSSNGFLSVSYQGTAGWAYAIYLNTEDDTPPSSGITATVIDGALNLRASASTSAGVVTVLPDGATVTLSGATSNGFSRVTWNGNTGWAYSLYLKTGDDGGGSGNGTFATVFDGALNLRSGAGTGYGVVRVLPDGARVELTGSTSNGFAQVIYQGTTGWASSQWLTTSGSSGSTATVIDGELNLRSSASTGSSVLLVMPNNATVTLLGQSSNGFAKVRYNGTDGWAYAIYLD